jgi:heme O synthase-like polyprenyltransferase
LAGIYIAAPEGVPTAILLHGLVGTALVAGGAAALNQVWERETDALMRRTQTRPIPGGRLRAFDGTMFGTVLSTVGLIELGWQVNLISAAVAAATLVSYVLVYTPLKKRTSLATLIGAVPGALPPVIGWARCNRNHLPPGVRALRDRVPLADAAFSGDRLALSRRLFARRHPAPSGARARRTTHRTASAALLPPRCGL